MIFKYLIFQTIYTIYMINLYQLFIAIADMVKRYLYTCIETSMLLPEISTDYLANSVIDEALACYPKDLGFKPLRGQ